MSDKVSYIGAPACFALEMACKQVRDAFSEGAQFADIHLVGSAMERPDWRDVDVRMMMDDAAFSRMFPGVDISHDAALWEFDPRWTLMVTAISLWMRQQTGLPIDFQFQPMTFANKRHDKPRYPHGLRFAPPTKEDDADAS